MIVPTPDGRFRAIVPDLPELELEGPTSWDVEQRLPGAIEAHLDALGGPAAPRRLARVVNANVYTSRYASLRSPRGPLPQAELERLVAALEQLLSCRGLGRELINVAFVALREVREQLPKPPPGPEPKWEGGFQLHYRARLDPLRLEPVPQIRLVPPPEPEKDE